MHNTYAPISSYVLLWKLYTKVNSVLALHLIFPSIQVYSFVAVYVLLYYVILCMNNTMLNFVLLNRQSSMHSRIILIYCELVHLEINYSSLLSLKWAFIIRKCL